MALTLPYPSLVFVPLDILTAEEQNEIVANYTYIANQFPIQTANMDLADLRGNILQSVVLTGTTNVNGIYTSTLASSSRVVCIKNAPSQLVLPFLGAGGSTWNFVFKDPVDMSKLASTSFTMTVYYC